MFSVSEMLGVIRFKLDFFCFPASYSLPLNAAGATPRDRTVAAVDSAGLRDAEPQTKKIVAQPVSLRLEVVFRVTVLNLRCCDASMCVALLATLQNRIAFRAIHPRAPVT